ncbi:MAG: 50S ribosomal protein L11 methyltransferase [Armatimonadetes bacterium]|nr:50S ribosomal protein L11 methyltransferase [Armatimonadota bacterium]
MRWTEITIKATDASADAVSSVLMEEGCGGTSISRVIDSNSPEAWAASQTGPGLQIPDQQRGPDPNVIGYLPVDDRLEGRLSNIRERIRRLPELGLPLASDEISLKWVSEDEWADAWKTFFKPIRLSNIVIKPSWEEFEPEEGDVVIDIDPGMAFGTGNHPTTQLCIGALRDYIEGGDTVLDVGTGSGILAMVAARLGAARVVGLDIDSVAVEAARENVERLGLDRVIQIDRADSPKAFDGQADVVIANIVPRVIIDMAPDLAAKVAPSGTLIASGIVTERADEVIAALENAGLKMLEQRRDAEWVSLIMQNDECRLQNEGTSQC